MIRVLCLIIGYLIGCIQTAYITGKRKANVDIRELGSGNAGTTNITRVFGLKTGVFVLLMDILKAIAAFVLCALVFAPHAPGADRLLLGLYAGFGVVIGHDFPFFLNFKGGRGIASSVGVMLCVDWRAGLIIAAIGIGLIAATRFVSLGSVVMMVLFPISVLVLGKGPEASVLAVILAALALYQHRGNIKRLLTGTERKIDFSKKGGAADDHSNEAGGDQ